MTVRAALLALACLCLSGPALQAEDAATEARWDFIEFEVKSWGEPVSSWRLTNRGVGSWTETRRTQADPRGAYTLVRHEIEEAPELYLALERILARLPSEAPDYEACANFMTDQAYGTIRLRKGATTVEFDWNSGCMDADYREFMETLRRADTLIGEAGRGGAILSEDHVQRR